MRRLLRRSVPLVLLVTLAACSSGTNCSSGITFYIGDVAGSLKAGATLPLTICFDGNCQVTTIKHAQTGGTVFLKFDGVGSKGDHTITVSAEGGVKGEYKGPIDTFDQKSGDGSCALAGVKIGADGKVTPGRIATTTTVAQATTTTKG
jgi:hypothetical protein